MSEEKVNVQVAAKALGVTTKTIHRWLTNGTLTKIKEGGRTFISMDEIRTLLQRQEETQKSDVSNFFDFSGQDKTVVPVERSHYEGLLTRLGQLEAKQELLLEYKEGLERKDKELSETKDTLARANNELQKFIRYKQDSEQKAKVLLEQQAKIDRLQEENERLKLPFWRRLFRK
jgi:DNA-binding transcriptional MerR regulator